MSADFDFNIVDQTLEDIGMGGDGLDDLSIVEPISKEPIKEPTKKDEPIVQPISKTDDLETIDDEDKDESDNATKNTSTSNDDNQFKVLAEEFFNIGILKKQEDENGNIVEPELPETPEEFKELWETQAQDRAASYLESYLSKFGEDRRELFDAIFEKGVDPKEYIPIYNKVQDWSNTNIEDETNQEKVVREYYKRLEWEDADINDQIENLKDTVKLEGFAKKFLNKIVEEDKQELRNQEQENERKILAEKRVDVEQKQNFTKILQEAVKTKELEGFPVTEKIAQETFDFIYNKKWKTQNGEQLTDLDKFILESKNPQNHKTRVLLGLLAKNNFDLSKIKKVAVSKESNELFSKLTTKNKTVSKSGSDSNKAWLDL